MILDYIAGGELFTHLYQHESFPVDQVRIYIAEIVLAMEQLHKRNVIYRDIKLENILLDADGHIVITDFGLSKELIEGKVEKAYSFCGTIEYMAPEVVKASVGHDIAVDWWSVGVLTYELLTGSSPFTFEGNSNMQPEISKRILKTEPPIPSHLDRDVADLISKLLIKDPRRRLNGNRRDADQIKAHPFFASINWADLAAKRVPAPFRPKITNILDTSNFSEEFTKMAPTDSPSQVPPNHERLFRGYSFVAPELLERRPSLKVPVAADVVESATEQLPVPPTTTGTIAEETIVINDDDDDDDDDDNDDDDVAIVLTPAEEAAAADEDDDDCNVVEDKSSLVVQVMPKPPRVSRFMEQISKHSQFHAKYEILSSRPIGEGSFSICMRCRQRSSGQTFAVKVLTRSNPATAGEVEMLQLCQGHETIVRLIDVLHDDQYTYIVTELLDGGELNERVSDGRLKDDDLETVVRQLVEGVAHIHSCGVAHRDLKPENIVFESMFSLQLRIVDFGFAKRIADTAGMRRKEYTLDYVAPELLFARPDRPVTEACDLWAMGAILFRIMCQDRPFGDGDDVALRIRDAKFNTDTRSWRSLEPTMRELIGSLMSLDVAKREVARAALHSNWLNGGGVKAVEAALVSDETTVTTTTEPEAEHIAEDGDDVEAKETAEEAAEAEATSTAAAAMSVRSVSDSDESRLSAPRYDDAVIYDGVDEDDEDDAMEEEHQQLVEPDIIIEEADGDEEDSRILFEMDLNGDQPADSVIENTPGLVSLTSTTTTTATSPITSTAPAPNDIATMELFNNNEKFVEDAEVAAEACSPRRTRRKPFAEPKAPSEPAAPKPRRNRTTTRQARQQPIFEEIREDLDENDFAGFESDLKRPNWTAIKNTYYEQQRSHDQKTLIEITQLLNRLTAIYYRSDALGHIDHPKSIMIVRGSGIASPDQSSQSLKRPATVDVAQSPAAAGNQPPSTKKARIHNRRVSVIVQARRPPARQARSTSSRKSAVSRTSSNSSVKSVNSVNDSSGKSQPRLIAAAATKPVFVFKEPFPITLNKEPSEPRTPIILYDEMPVAELPVPVTNVEPMTPRRKTARCLTPVDYVGNDDQVRKEMRADNARKRQKAKARASVIIANTSS